MLVLERRRGECLVLFDKDTQKILGTVEVTRASHDRATLGIDALASLYIGRPEVLEGNMRQQYQALLQERRRKDIDNGK